MMKTKRNAKILVLVLSLVLVIGAAFAVMASAEDATKPVIFSKNIAYEGNFGIMYAVDATTVKEGTVTLNLYFAEPTAESTPDKVYTDSTVDTIKAGGVSYQAYTFQTAGVAAKDMTDVFYVQAVDSEGNKSEVVAYSVVEYMLERLYGGNEITEAQKEVYEAALVFGAKAQALLASTDPVKVTDYKYVTVAGGTVDGVAKKMVASGTTVTPVGEGAVAWKVTDVDTGESTVANLGSAITVTANVAITPITELTDPASTGRGNGAYYAFSEKFSVKNVTELYNAGMVAPSDRDGTVPNKLLLDDKSTGEYAAIDLHNYNSALHIVSKLNQDPRFLIKNFVDGTTTANNDCYIFEADFNFDSLTVAGDTNTTFFSAAFDKGFSQTGSHQNPATAIFLVRQDTTKTVLDGKYLAFNGLTTYSAAATATPSEYYYPIELGKWYNIRAEIKDIRGTATATYYLDGELLGTAAYTGGGYELDSVALYTSWGEANGSVYVDNFYFANVGDGVIGADETHRGSGVYYNNGAQTYDNTTVTALDTKIGGGIGSFGGDGDVSLDVTTGDYVNVSPVNGNAALHFGSTKTWSPYIYFANNLSMGDNIANGTPATTPELDDYVFETDILLDSLTKPSGDGYYLEIRFHQEEVWDSGISEQTNLAMVIMKDENGFYLAAAGTEIARLDLDKWFNLRVEVINASVSGGATRKIYVNNECVYTAENLSVHGWGIPMVLARMSWNEVEGSIYFDNTIYTLK